MILSRRCGARTQGIGVVDAEGLRIYRLCLNCRWMSAKTGGGSTFCGMGTHSVVCLPGKEWDTHPG